jgi:hypothetical protein
MPFWLYERSSKIESRYTQKAQLYLFGYRQGLIYHAIKDALPVAFEKRKDFSWVRTEADLLKGRGFDPNRHAAVIDLDPNRKNGILMGVIRGMAGQTHETWTPFVIFMDVIEEARSAENKLTLNFEDATNHCCTILYAQGGWSDTKKFRQYTAQPRGGLAAAVLWPPTFNHLTKSGLEWIEHKRITSETRYS